MCFGEESELIPKWDVCLGPSPPRKAQGTSGKSRQKVEQDYEDSTEKCKSRHLTWLLHLFFHTSCGYLFMTCTRSIQENPVWMLEGHAPQAPSPPEELLAVGS